jgi:hypothetical protein
MNACCTRIVTVSPTRRRLDVQVGFALWKDRRVAAMTKLLAAAFGITLMMGLVAVERILTHWAIGPNAASQLSVNSLVLSSGALLFSTIALLWMAPASAVNMVRLQQAGVIPLRIRNR